MKGEERSSERAGQDQELALFRQRPVAELAGPVGLAAMGQATSWRCRFPVSRCSGRMFEADADGAVTTWAIEATLLGRHAGTRLGRAGPQGETSSGAPTKPPGPPSARP